MATVKGVYTFNDTLTPATFESQDVYFDFFDADTGYQRRGIRIGVSEVSLVYCYNRYHATNPEIVETRTYEAYIYPNDYNLPVGWFSTASKTVDFGETPQEVSGEFYAWLMENAVSNVIEINITQNGTTTLATAGKYCDRNIDLNVDVSAVNAILDGSFSGAYENDRITSLKTHIFSEMKNIASISLPNCTDFVGQRHFYNAENLESVYLPNLTIIENGTYTFANTKIRELDLPSLTTINGTVTPCYSMQAVERINLPKLGGATMGNSGFYNTKALTTLVLGGDVLNPLGNTNAFNDSGIAKGTGYVYVPDDLVDTYKTATNWATFADQIKPISELEE
ncbi:MAG: hypothetical protein E7421_00430 [Ruminococcaceae bacterium]|nr:hypothetical protein [Oscillospiraceae bacterium]